MAILTPGGGGNEIGASFYPITLDDGVIIAFDCGGRPGSYDSDIIVLPDEYIGEYLSSQIIAAKNKNPYPNFDVVAHVDYLILTHGHYDHVGKVVELVKRDPHIVVYATAMTKALCSFHWYTTIRLAEGKEVKAPFDYADVEYALSRFVLVNATNGIGDSVAVTPNLSIIPVRAGHIEGATSFFVFYKGVVVMYVSGDTSYSNQRTVEGAPKIEYGPLSCMMVDSTRLIEVNTPRDDVEEACIKAIQDDISQGRSVRFLTFSIGRSQEAYELAKEACATMSGMQHTPIWIDGSAREVTDLYLKYSPNWKDAEVRKHFVADKAHRNRIIYASRSGEPNIVIVPSAMQFGGYARQYMAHGISRDDHAYYSLGWLDPCSPEYAFFEMPRRSVFRFMDSEAIRFCEVRRFNLTAHLDGEDILEMRERMRPDITVCVHGDDVRIDEFIALHPGEGFVKGTNEASIKVF